MRETKSDMLARGTRLSQNATTSKRNIMAAILQSLGPVATHKVVARNWKFLRMLTVKQYLMAAQDLESANLGSLVAVETSKGRVSHVFIKKLPSEIQPFLAANPDLCTLEYFEARFNKPVSKSVSLIERHHIARLGLVPASLMM